MSGERRSTLRRIGLAALNILGPGLGLLRLGQGRAASIFLLILPAALLVLLGYYALAPTIGFREYATASVLLLASLAAALLGSIWLSWRRSGVRAEEKPWWSRWYSILAAWVALTAAAGLLGSALHGFYKPFYLPAQGMAPTLVKNDRILASMSRIDELRRGDVILLNAHDSIYVKRIAGLPGDRIALRDGVVLLNGRAVRQRVLGRESITDFSGRATATRVAEQFPGEAKAHHIYDLGTTEYDDVLEQVVAPGHIFVLGDNRDRSADSRVPREDMGVEQVRISDVRGRPLFFNWGSGREKRGRPVGP